MKNNMLQKLILYKKNLQIKYLKELFQMLSIVSIVFILGSVAFYMGDFELLIILFFLFIYFVLDVVRSIKDKKLELVVNAFFVQNI